MIDRSVKTAAILAAFLAVGGTAVMIPGCGAQKAQGDELKDENGRTYHLVQNEDGTETARYDDGQEVTFKRDENDNLQYVSGMSSLLPMLMMSYFLFHGMGGYTGHYDRNTGNVLNDRPAYTDKKRDQQGNSGGYSGSGYGSNKNNTSVSSQSTDSSSVKAPAGGKTGFGGAGVRGGAS